MIQKQYTIILSASTFKIYFFINTVSYNEIHTNELNRNGKDSDAVYMKCN